MFCSFQEEAHFVTETFLHQHPVSGNQIIRFGLARHNPLSG